MFSLFIVYNQNLSQLSVRLLFAKIDLNSLGIEIMKTTFILLIESKRISIQFNNYLELEPISLRQLTAIKVDQNHNKSIEICFTLTAKMGLFSRLTYFLYNVN